MTFPDFTCPTRTGRAPAVDSAGRRRDGRPPEPRRALPTERMHHRELLRFHEWCAVAFTAARHASCRTRSTTSYKMKIATGARWTFLADEELEVNSPLRDRRVHRHHHDYAVVPHTVILSPGLVIEKVYVGYWFWGRPSPEQLWRLGEIHARIKPDFDPTLPEPREEWEAELASAGVLGRPRVSVGNDEPPSSRPGGEHHGRYSIRRLRFTGRDRTPEKTRVDVVRLGDTTAGRFTFEPGWKWSECIGRWPAPRARSPNVGVVHSGRMHCDPRGRHRDRARPATA